MGLLALQAPQVPTAVLGLLVLGAIPGQTVHLALLVQWAPQAPLAQQVYPGPLALQVLWVPMAQSAQQAPQALRVPTA